MYKAERVSIGHKIFRQVLPPDIELSRYHGAIHYYGKLKRWLLDDRSLALSLHRRKCCKGTKKHFKQH